MSLGMKKARNRVGQIPGLRTVAREGQSKTIKLYLKNSLYTTSFP